MVVDASNLFSCPFFVKKTCRYSIIQHTQQYQTSNPQRNKNRNFIVLSFLFLHQGRSVCFGIVEVETVTFGCRNYRRNLAKKISTFSWSYLLSKEFVRLFILFYYLFCFSVVLFCFVLFCFVLTAFLCVALAVLVLNSVYQAGLKLRNLPASDSQVLVLKAWTTTVRLVLKYTSMDLGIFLK